MTQEAPDEPVMWRWFIRWASDLPVLKGSSAADDVITPMLAPVPLWFIRCSRLGSSALYKLSDVYSGQYTDALTLVASDHPVPLGFLPRDLTSGQNCSDPIASVYPMTT